MQCQLSGKATLVQCWASGVLTAASDSRLRQNHDTGEDLRYAKLDPQQTATIVSDRNGDIIDRGAPLMEDRDNLMGRNQNPNLMIGHANVRNRPDRHEQHGNDGQNDPGCRECTHHLKRWQCICYSRSGAQRNSQRGANHRATGDRRPAAKGAALRLSRNL